MDYHFLGHSGFKVPAAVTALKRPWSPLKQSPDQQVEGVMVPIIGIDRVGPESISPCYSGKK
jgi:hypothetical protein